MRRKWLRNSAKAPVILFVVVLWVICMIFICLGEFAQLFIDVVVEGSPKFER